MVHAFDINHNIPPCEGEPTGTIQSMANVGVVGFKKKILTELRQNRFHYRWIVNMRIPVSNNDR